MTYYSTRLHDKAHQSQTPLNSPSSSHRKSERLPQVCQRVQVHHSCIPSVPASHPCNAAPLVIPREVSSYSDRIPTPYPPPSAHQPSLQHIIRRRARAPAHSHKQRTNQGFYLLLSGVRFPSRRSRCLVLFFSFFSFFLLSALTLAHAYTSQSSES